ncbi:hypothetical protein [Mangrovibacterium sp.]|uniref:hypothetical protein n=1 Tax=Mangrovibacterium sp. TaxID=1961364 RepID=UPI003569C0EC
MKPVRAFLFLLSVLSILFLVSFYRSKRNQEYLHAPNPPIPEQTKPRELAIPLENLSGLSESDHDSLPQEDTVRKFTPDTVLLAETTILPEGNTDSRLLFAPNDTIGLRNLALQLQTASFNKSQLRIFYYGDSQIEGDQITSAMRKKLQERYGGRGPGLIVPDQFYNPPHQLMMTRSDNWQFPTLKEMSGQNKSILFHNALAIDTAETAWFRINRLRFLDPQEDYNQIQVFFESSDSVLIECFQSAEPIYRAQVMTGDRTQNMKLKFDQTPEDLKITYTCRDSLWVSGLSLESESGIFVDNIALRGLSYPPFSSSGTANLKEMINELQPAMFIIHFGVNVVPYFSESYTAFRHQFARQIKRIRELSPQAPILIIGVSDMSHRVNGNMESYANIHQIKQIQYSLAMENGCLFWDLESFMGGPGSMIRWVESNPPLGRKDYIHFAAAGATKIGEELAKLLIEQFDPQQQTAWKSN